MSQGLRVANLSSTRDVAETRRAIKEGYDILYQAPLESQSLASNSNTKGFRGIADFLVKTQVSNGEHVYEASSQFGMKCFVLFL